MLNFRVIFSVYTTFENDHSHLTVGLGSGEVLEFFGQEADEMARVLGD